MGSINLWPRSILQKALAARRTRKSFCARPGWSLLKTDLLYESLAALLRANPFTVLLCPIWLLGGKVRLKVELARRMTADPGRLPYNERVLEYHEHRPAAGAWCWRPHPIKGSQR